MLHASNFISTEVIVCIFRNLKPYLFTTNGSIIRIIPLELVTSLFSIGHPHITNMKFIMKEETNLIKCIE